MRTKENSVSLQHGKFSLKDAKLLKECIRGLIELEDGRRAPVTEAQNRFINVCRGLVGPHTEYELAYLRWRRSRPNIKELLADAEYELESKKNYKEKKRESRARNDDEFERACKALRDKPKRDRELSKIAGPSTKAVAQPYKKRFIEETWGNRDAWRRDRARNRFDGR